MRSDYIENDFMSPTEPAAQTSPSVRPATRPLPVGTQGYLRGCRRCSAVYDSTRKMLVITGNERVFEVPSGFSERLHGFLNKVISETSAH